MVWLRCLWVCHSPYDDKDKYKNMCCKVSSCTLYSLFFAFYINCQNIPNIKTHRTIRCSKLRSPNTFSDQLNDYLVDNLNDFVLLGVVNFDDGLLDHRLYSAINRMASCVTELNYNF